jgi:hypothetical protein
MVCVVSSDTYLDPAAGKPSVIRGIAAGLKQETAEKTLLAIHTYLDGSMRMIEPAAWDHPSRRRTTSVEILREGAWGCSAHAQVACHLARACGIPAILAKSLDVEWIKCGNQGDGRGKGHVYVEVLMGGKRCLWDAQRGELHEDYDPKSGLVPGGARRIYDKGGPDALVLSHHGNEWEAETKRLFPKAETQGVT